jgi:capsular exopolysaccharide synthesis family protein
MKQRVSGHTTSLVDGGRHLTDYLRVIYKRRWTAAAAFVLVFASGTFRTLRTTPVYEATTQLEIVADHSLRSNSISSMLDSQPSWFEDEFYLTQYRILESRALAWQAISSLGLPPVLHGEGEAGEPHAGVVSRIVGWAAAAVGAPKRIEPPPADETTAQSEQIDQFLEGLSVVPVRNTRLVDVQYRSEDPLLAARSANAVAEQYRLQGLKSRFLSSKETADWLGHELEEQKKRVDQSERALQAYRESHDVVSVADEGQNIVVRKLVDLNAAVTRAKTERFDKEAEYKRLLALRERPGDLESLPAVMANSFVQSLKTEINALRQKRTELSQTFIDGAPQMLAVDNQIKLAEAKLQVEINNVVKVVENQFFAARDNEQTLAKALAAQTQEALQLNRKGIEYAALERDAVSNRQLYENLLQRAKETGVTGDFKGSNVRIIDTAEVPRTPVLPRTERDLLMSLVGGCLLALALVFGFEYMDSRMKTPDDVKEHLGMPFLGLVPVIPGKEGAPAPLLDGDVTPAFTEAMRAVRTAVMFSTADEGARSLVVTSTAPSEGKTLISSNLGVALAQAGLRTLVVDADMRRPRLHDVFGCTQEPGLSNVLVGTARLSVATKATTTPNLHLVPAGHLPPNPAELLGSARYLELLEEFGRSYEWIIIDAPPVMAVTDACVAANRATGVVFVVGAEMTPLRNAKAAVEQLAAVRARFIGAVLNRVNLSRHAYYYAPYYRKDYSRVYERSV